MQKVYRVAIVGGGAAGLMSALHLVGGSHSLRGEDVLVLERNDRVGKKLIATGNGLGNLMNAVFSQENYYGDKEFIDAFISHAKKVDLESYLYNLGLPLCTLKDGKKYPLSRQASSVLDIFRLHLEKSGCNVIVNAKAENIYKRDNVFTISTTAGEFNCENLIIATGGASAKQFGTDGTAYALVEKFGHKKTPLYPSLVQLKCDLKDIRGLKGLKETARVTALSNGKVLKSSVGEVLFTEYGVSGNAVFQVSGHLTNALNPELKIEFLPEMQINKVEELLVAREKIGGLVGENRLLGIINKRIGQAVIKRSKSQTAKDVAKTLKDFRLKVTGNLGFNYAQVTKGGIKTDGVDKLDMQSKLVKNMYLVGEMLDVDGDCGGYNLTFAFVSAITAAENIKNKYINIGSSNG